VRLLTRLSLLIPATILAVGGVAFGSGFSIFEQGAKATAMGGAFVATADDPSAIFYNVAGIAQQRHLSFISGATIINFSNDFTGDQDDPFTVGISGANYKRHTFTPPNAYLVVPIGENLTFGVGAFSAFGLRTNWQDDFPGRFISRDANVKTLSVEPAIAWQTSDGRFALGAGAEYRRAKISLNRNNGALNPFTQNFADVANVYLASDWENNWGWNVGLLFKPTPQWRFGASYRTDQTIDFKGDAKFTQILTGNAQFDAAVRAGLPANQGISTSINFPAIAAVGVATTIIPNWDVEFDVTHTTWSRFKNLDIAFDNTPALNLHRPQNWEDTNSFRLGANHPVNPNWDVRFGVVYDENPQPTEGVGPLLPDSDREGVSFGVGYHKGPWIIDATEFVLHFKDRSTGGINSDHFNGTYKTDANLISVNFGYRF
jgi:long-chain fatty acid transport protein